MMQPSLWLAFLAGLASFLSPCVFALVPVYVGYLAGRSTGSAASDRPLDTFAHGLAFVLGFSAVFILLGLFSAAIGQFLFSLSRVLAQVGGIVVILLGLHLSGIFPIRWLNYQLSTGSAQSLPRSYASSALMGVFFSAGWIPCVGPVLGAILTLALNGAALEQGALLLAAYSAGLAIPFLLAATQISWTTRIVRRYARLSHYVERITGVVLILLGALLFSGRFSTLASFGFFFDTFDEGRVGLLLLAAIVASVALGLLGGAWARRKGNDFTQGWFLTSGLLLLMFVVLYLAEVIRV
jgi:cytochrome c-type biogenesis protein